MEPIFLDPIDLHIQPHHEVTIRTVKVQEVLFKTKDGWNVCPVQYFRATVGAKTFQEAEGKLTVAAFLWQDRFKTGPYGDTYMSIERYERISQNAGTSRLPG